DRPGELRAVTTAHGPRHGRRSTALEHRSELCGPAVRAREKLRASGEELLPGVTRQALCGRVHPDERPGRSRVPVTDVHEADHVLHRVEGDGRKVPRKVV